MPDTWPKFWEQYAWLAWGASVLLMERRNRYPDLVRRGKLTNVEAGESTRLMQAVADEWEAIARLAPEPEGAGRILRADKAATLVIARNLYAHRLGKRAQDVQLGAMLECIDTLIWHYQFARYGPLFARDDADKAIARGIALQRETA